MLKIFKKENGFTIIELAVVIILIALFASILVSDFPKILKRFALSRTAHKLAQDIRRAQDLSLSGIRIGLGDESSVAKGYGVYLNTGESQTEYIIYADNDPLFYDRSDYIVETVDISKENSDLYIKDIINISAGSSDTSINYRPPNPAVDIENLRPGAIEIGIILGLRSDSSIERKIWANKAGLIKIE